MLGERPNTISNHLAVMKAAGILTSKRDGGKVYYEINNTYPLENTSVCSADKHFIQNWSVNVGVTYHPVKNGKHKFRTVFTFDGGRIAIDSSIDNEKERANWRLA